MKCEHCHNNEATFFYEETINGESRSMQLCAECAAKMKKDGTAFGSGAFPFSGDLLSGLFGLSAPSRKESGKTCPGCGATWKHLLEGGKASCPQCYATFGEELKPTLRSLHGNVTHVGRAPADRRAKKEKLDRLTALTRSLADAIREEKFEDAAKLRDEIRELEKE